MSSSSKRLYSPPSAPHPSKRPRFDPRNPSVLAADQSDPSTRTADTDELDDAILDLDEVGVGVRRIKRGAVRLEGYDSDSSNEGGFERKDGGSKKKEEDDEEDMFGGASDDEDEKPKKDGGKNKKEVRFMSLDEIEGQESDNDEEHVSISMPSYNNNTPQTKGKGRATSSPTPSDSDEEEKVKEELASLDPELGLGALKHAAPKLDAFNMRAEMEEGRFDSAGNFVRNAADVDAVHDSWLEGVSRKEMKKAKEAQEKRDRERKERNRRDDEVLTGDLLSTLIGCMEVGETVLETLARLGAEAKREEEKEKKATGKMSNTQRWKLKRQQKQEKNGDAMDTDAPSTTTTTTKPDSETPHQASMRARRDLIESFTGAADALLTRGDLEIYDAERELLIRRYKRETGDEWVDPSKHRNNSNSPPPAGANTQWEYRWADNRDPGADGQPTVYGPFSGENMKAWEAHGYFAGGGVEFRTVVDGERGPWSLVGGF